jgi:CheY-like chemotaxis protein
MHGGDVSAHSDGSGKGATFEIHLPLVAAHEPPPKTAGSLRTTPRRVLVVDDNVDAADSLAMLLHLDGHTTEAVYSPYEVIDHIRTFAPDLVLLDIGLPGLDGYELARRIRAMPDLAGLKLVALTGYGQPEDRHRAFRAGFDAHVVKPVSMDALEQVLEIS